MLRYILSGDNAMLENCKTLGTGLLADELVNDYQISATPVIGKYGEVENSLIFTGLAPMQVEKLALKYGQESYIVIDSDYAYLVYTGKNECNRANLSETIFWQFEPADYYTFIPAVGYFSYNFDFDVTYPFVTKKLSRSDITWRNGTKSFEYDGTCDVALFAR